MQYLQCFKLTLSIQLRIISVLKASSWRNVETQKHQVKWKKPDTKRPRNPPYIKCLEKANLQRQTVDSSCSGQGWGQGWTMNGCEEGSHWDDENVPRLDYDNGCTIW